MNYTNKQEVRINWNGNAPVIKTYNPEDPNSDRTIDRLGVCPALTFTYNGNDYLIAVTSPALIFEKARNGTLATSLFVIIGDVYCPIPTQVPSIELNDIVYRNLTTGSKVSKEIALDEDGLLNAGYCTNLEFFIRTVGMDVWLSPIAIYSYIYTGLTEIITELPNL